MASLRTFVYYVQGFTGFKYSWLSTFVSLEVLYSNLYRLQSALCNLATCRKLTEHAELFLDFHKLRRQVNSKQSGTIAQNPLPNPLRYFNTIQSSSVGVNVQIEYVEHGDNAYHTERKNKVNS